MRRNLKFSPSLSVRAPFLMLLAAALGTAAVHTGVVTTLAQRPIGHVDPRDVTSMRPPVRIKRATFDLVTPAPVAPPDAQPPSTESAGDRLLDQIAAQRSPDAPPLADRLRPVIEEAPPSSVNTDPDVEDFRLPPALLDRLGEQLTADLRDLDYEATGRGAPVAAARRLLTVAGRGGGSGGALEPGAAALRADSRVATDVDGPLAAGLRRRPDPVVEIDPLQLPLAAPPPVPVRVLDNDFDYKLTRYEQDGEPGYFRVEIAARRSLRKLKTMPKDVVFLVDTSGSMSFGWVKRSVEGVGQALGTLNASDRFNIVLFSDKLRFFDPHGIQPATPDNLRRAASFLAAARSKGFTDVNTALSRLLRRDVATDRVYNLILITDGLPTRGVLDTRDLINLITRDNDQAVSIYCVGVGGRQNRQLLDFLAHRNRGYCLFADSRQRVGPTIVDLASRIRYPLIKNVRHDVVGLGGRPVYPVDLPNIHQGERFSIYGRYDEPVPFTMRLAGSSAGRPVDFTFRRDLEEAPMGDEGISSEWAFGKLHHLYSEIIRLGESPRLLRQIARLRDRYKLKTLY